MIVRIVRLAFTPEYAPQFPAVFHRSQPKILAIGGCNRVELFTDATEPGVFYTHSSWGSLEALEAYRQSELFQTTWAEIKPHFSARPQAFSLEAYN